MDGLAKIFTIVGATININGRGVQERVERYREIERGRVGWGVGKG